MQKRIIVFLLILLPIVVLAMQSPSLHENHQKVTQLQQDSEPSQEVLAKIKDKLNDLEYTAQEIETIMTDVKKLDESQAKNYLKLLKSKTRFTNPKNYPSMLDASDCCKNHSPQHCTQPDYVPQYMNMYKCEF